MQASGKNQPISVTQILPPCYMHEDIPASAVFYALKLHLFCLKYERGLVVLKGQLLNNYSLYQINVIFLRINAS